MACSLDTPVSLLATLKLVLSVHRQVNSAFPISTKFIDTLCSALSKDTAKQALLTLEILLPYANRRQIQRIIPNMLACHDNPDSFHRCFRILLTYADDEHLSSTLTAILNEIVEDGDNATHYMALLSILFTSLSPGQRDILITRLVAMLTPINATDTREAASMALSSFASDANLQERQYVLSRLVPLCRANDPDTQTAALNVLSSWKPGPTFTGFDPLLNCLSQDNLMVRQAALGLCRTWLPHLPHAIRESLSPHLVRNLYDERKTLKVEALLLLKDWGYDANLIQTGDIWLVFSATLFDNGQDSDAVRSAAREGLKVWFPSLDDAQKNALFDLVVAESENISNQKDALSILVKVILPNMRHPLDHDPIERLSRNHFPDMMGYIIDIYDNESPENQHKIIEMMGSQLITNAKRLTQFLAPMLTLLRKVKDRLTSDQLSMLIEELISQLQPPDKANQSSNEADVIDYLFSLADHRLKQSIVSKAMTTFKQVKFPLKKRYQAFMTLLMALPHLENTKHSPHEISKGKAIRTILSGLQIKNVAFLAGIKLLVTNHLQFLSQENLATVVDTFASYLSLEPIKSKNAALLMIDILKTIEPVVTNRERIKIVNVMCRRYQDKDMLREAETILEQCIPTASPQERELMINTALEALQTTPPTATTRTLINLSLLVNHIPSIQWPYFAHALRPFLQHENCSIRDMSWNILFKRRLSESYDLTAILARTEPQQYERMYINLIASAFNTLSLPPIPEETTEELLEEGDSPHTLQR